MPVFCGLYKAWWCFGTNSVFGCCAAFSPGGCESHVAGLSPRPAPPLVCLGHFQWWREAGHERCVCGHPFIGIDLCVMKEATASQSTPYQGFTVNLTPPVLAALPKWIFLITYRKRDVIWKAFKRFWSKMCAYPMSPLNCWFLFLLDTEEILDVFWVNGIVLNHWKCLKCVKMDNKCLGNKVAVHWPDKAVPEVCWIEYKA